MSSSGTIGTHDGRFHCDEVFAVFLLRQLPEFENYSVVRTRDMDVLANCDVLVDVGSIYDPEKFKFDHHQREFDVTWSSFFNIKSYDVKLSSAGLVYAHFGKRVLSLMTNLEEDSESLQRLFYKVYESFVLEIDGSDNGIAPSNGPTKYHILSGLSSRVQRLGPWWNEDSQNNEEGFWKAYDMIEQEFRDVVKYFHKCWLPAREFVIRAMNQRESVDTSKAIIVLERSCPWKTHLRELEKEERSKTVIYPLPPHLTNGRGEPKLPPKVLFVILPGDNDNWIAQCVPSEKFESRLPFPEEWRSLQNDELSRVSGIPGCIFVHSCGHLGVNQTKEGALAMARAVVRKRESEENAPLPKPTFSRGRGSRDRRR